MELTQSMRRNLHQRDLRHSDKNSSQQPRFHFIKLLGHPPKGLLRDEARELIAWWNFFSMNRFTNTYGHATSASQPANENSVPRLFHWVVRRVANRRTKVLARVATCALLLGPLVPVHGGWLKPDVDYS